MENELFYSYIICQCVLCAWSSYASIRLNVSDYFLDLPPGQCLLNNCEKTNNGVAVVHSASEVV